MKNLIFIIGLVILTNFSCQKKSLDSNNYFNDSLIYVSVEDSSLISIILKFKQAVTCIEPYEHVIVVKLYTENNKKFYEINYETNLIVIGDLLPTYYTILYSKMVILHTDDFNYNQLIEMNADSLLERALPKEFEYYKKYNDYGPPMLYKRETWYFKNDELQRIEGR